MQYPITPRPARTTRPPTASPILAALEIPEDFTGPSEVCDDEFAVNGNMGVFCGLLCGGSVEPED